MNLPFNIQVPAGERQRSSLGVLNWASMVLMLAGIFIVLLYGATFSAKATIFMWMLACLLSGAIIGFLFGIPKVLQGNGKPTGNSNTTEQTSADVDMTGVFYQPQVNTNLTEISDWLTKIIVGLGLVNLTKIPTYLNKVAMILGTALGNCKKDDCVSFAFAYGIIITYLIFGFLASYIITRLYLAGAFIDADRSLINNTLDKVKKLEAASQSANRKADFALRASLDGASDNTDLTVNLELTVKLMAEYNTVRATMPAGAARTDKMTQIFIAMYKAAQHLIDYDVAAALQSANDGERLFAYAYLYIKPDVALLDKLVEAFTGDALPFNQYWGIQAMGKIMASQAGAIPSAAAVSKLQPYFDGLKEYEDRKYELDLLLPALKKQ